MIISGSVSPRTTSRVDLTSSQALYRPCRVPPPEEVLLFEEDVVFDWSKSIPPDYDESKRSKERIEGENNETHLSGLFAEVNDASLTHRPASGSMIASTLSLPLSFDYGGSVDEISSRATSRCESVPLSRTGAFSPYRCQTAPPQARTEPVLNGGDMVDVVTEHEIRTRERSKSCRLYSGRGKKVTDGNPSTSARKVRRPNEERYLQRKYRERPCSRAESFVNEELFDSTSDLSREYCDVLGPRHCYDCFRITQRNDAVHRNKSSLPSIHMTPKNFSNITLIQRLCPELTAMDILEGMADGHISSRSFSRERLLEIYERKKAEAKKREIQEKWKGAAKSRISAFSVPDKIKFFSNFTDLRAQILAQQGSYTGYNGTLFPVTQLQLPPPTQIELVMKKEEDRENPANYFCPPLMTREEIQRQKNQPRFYAGADQVYKLPEAPPLTDFVHKSNKAIREMDADGLSTNSERMQGPSHESQKDTKPLSILSDNSFNGHMFNKPTRIIRPSTLGRPEMRGAFARKALTASSFSRPLQMETLTEDGSQSEREDMIEEDEDEDDNGEEEQTEIKETRVKGNWSDRVG